MMVNNKDPFRRNTSLLIFGTFVNKGLQFITIPLFSKWLSVEDYGRFDLLYTAVSLLIPIVTLSNQEAIFRLSVDEDEDNNKGHYISTGFCFDIVNLFMISIFAHVLWHPANTSIFLAFVFYLISETLSTYLRGYLRAIKNLDIYSYSMALSTVLMFGSVLVFVRIYNLGLVGILMGYGVGTFIGDLIIIVWSKWTSWFSIKLFRIKNLLEMIRYSIPLVPNELSWWVMNASDRQIINWNFGYSANGIYAIAHKIPSMCSVIFTTVSISWQQEIVEKINAPDSYNYVNKVFERYVMVLMSICSGLLAGSFILFDYIFDVKYYEAIYYTPILILSSIFVAISQFYGGIQIALKQPKQNGITTVVGAISNVLVHIMLIPLIGLFAASISTLVSNILIVVLRMRLVNNYYKAKVTKKMVISCLFTIYFFICAYLFRVTLLNIINLVAVCIVAVVMNMDFIKSIMPKVKNG